MPISPPFDDDAPRVFCLSMQRSGTTSVGKALRDFGYAWAGWPADERNNWSAAWYRGDFESIFASGDFRHANAFEDSPWFVPDFYKVLFHRFRNARFVMFTREPEAWLRSMISHSRGDIIGFARIHCKVYRRELEYFDLVRRGIVDPVAENTLFTPKTMKIADCPDHYMAMYRLHTLEVQEFFNEHNPAALHVGALDDPDKWQKLGAFLGVQVPAGYDCHENRSP
jgi:hypothetical protein